MAQFELTRKHRNDIFDMLKKQSLEPASFKWGELGAIVGHSNGYQLTTESEGRKFVFKFRLDSHSSYFCADLNPKIDEISEYIERSWPQFLTRFHHWAGLVAYEIHTPDRWSEMSKNPILSSNPESYTHTERFSPAEVAAIRERLQKVEAFIVAKAGTDEKGVSHIHQSFNYLSEGLDKNSKVDWKNIFAAQIIAMIGTFATEHSAEILKFCVEQLAPFFRELFHLPQ